MTIAQRPIEEDREERQRGIQIAAVRRSLVLEFELQILDPWYEARWRAATPATLDRYLARVLTADSVAAVFADRGASATAVARAVTASSSASPRTERMPSSA